MRRAFAARPALLRIAACFAPLLAAAFLVACSASAAPRPATLADLVARQDAFEGATVEVLGQVVRFTEAGAPDYFVLEDRDQNRVLLLPASVAEPYGGDTVCVTGRFHFRADQGRTIQVREIAPDLSASGVGCGG